MWSDEKEERFLSMVEDRPSLFSADDKNYSNRTVRNESWRQIAEELNIPERQLRKKWESLRTQFARYKKPPAPGSPSVEKTRRQTWVLSKMQFLQPHWRRRESKPEEPAAPADTRRDDGAEASFDCQRQEELDQQLISLVEARPALFAADDKNYSNRQAKTDSWRQISEEMNTSERDLRKKWESLRTQFLRYRKLPRPAADFTARQKWILGKMHFLEPHTRRRETMNVAHKYTHFLKEPTGPTDTSTGASVDANAKKESGEDQAACEEETSGTPPASRGRKRRKALQTESLSETSQGLMRLIAAALERRAAQETPSEDFIAVACKGIELKFRMLPPHLVPRLENTIQNVIFNFFEENNVTQHPDNSGLDPCLMLI